MLFWIKIVKPSLLFLISSLAWGDASRIVTLAPSLAEIVADLLDESLSPLVGVSDGSSYPPSLKKKTRVGPYHRPNLEQIVGLKPDLVLATQDGNPKEIVDRLNELHIPTLVVNTPTLGSISNSIEEIALRLGLKKKGIELASRLRTGLNRFKKGKSKHKRVAVIVGWNPLVVAGTGSFLDDALELLQVTNVYTKTVQHYPRPSFEDLLARKPEYLIVVGERLFFPKGWDALFPMETKVRYLPVDLLTTPSLRILEGLSILEKSLAN